MKKRNLIGRIFGIGLAFVLVGAMLVPLQARGDTKSEGNFQWTTNGPYGGYVNCLVMATTNPDIIYAGTDGGVFKTINEGDTWTRTGFPEILVWVVQVAPDNSDIVYAGTNDGIYKSEDGGSTWTQKGLSGARVNAIAIDPSNSNVLYVATGKWEYAESDVGVYKSVDGGNSWEKRLDATDIEDGNAVYTLLIDSDNSQIVYAGVDGWTKQLYKSTDGGVTWVGEDVGTLTGPDVVALAMTPAGFSPATIYAVGSGDVYKSTDLGETWEPTGTPWISPGAPWALAVDPNNPNVVYVGTHHYQGGRLYKSPDGGDTWSIKVNGLPPACPSSIVVDPRNSDIYVGLEEGGVYKSTDGAESWNFSSQGMINTFIEGLAVDPTSSNKAFAAIKGRGHYLAKTTNGGNSWDYLVGSATNLGAVAIDPQSPSTIFGGQGCGWTGGVHIYKSTDGGESWIDIEFLEIFGGSAYLGVSDIWVNPSNSSIIMVAVAGLGTKGGGVYRSTDGGATWSSTFYSGTATLVRVWTTTLTADPTIPDILYFGTIRNYYLTRYGEVFRSTDGGSSWTEISPGGDWVGEVRDIEVDLNSQVYVATDEGLMKWDGSDWITLTGAPTDDITALTIDRAVSPGIIYVGTGGEGVFVSQDGGTTWIPFNEGLGNLSITKLAISATEPKMLYAGTKYGGVYSCMIGELNNPPYEPTNPSPASGATNVPVDADLSWTGGDPDLGDTVTYDVYFDTVGATTLVSNDQSATTYDPGTLSNNTKYYWKIVATDNHTESTTGPVWDFTTGGVCEVDISVELQGGSRPPEGWEVPITIKFFSPGADVMTDTPVYEFNLTTTKSDDTATCQCAGVMPGTYDVTAQASNCPQCEEGNCTLMNVRRGVVISTPSTAVDMGTLLAGDANCDGIINISDFGILAVAYMCTEGEPCYDCRADFDCNGIINISDFGLLAVNYMKLSPIDIS